MSSCAELKHSTKNIPLITEQESADLICMKCKSAITHLQLKKNSLIWFLAESYVNIFLFARL